MNTTVRYIEYQCSSRGTRLKKVIDVSYCCSKCGKEDVKEKRSYEKSDVCFSCVLSEKKSKHSGSRGGHPLYSTWKGMRDRCRRNKYYKNVSWSKSWNSFDNFRDDVMSIGWKPGLEIDRINSDLDYCKENVMLSTRSENAKRAMEKRWSKEKIR